MHDSITWIGLGVFLALVFGGSSILDAIRDYANQRHIERMTAQLPEAERIAFIRRYLEEDDEGNRHEG